jgi:hypothetical protein
MTATAAPIKASTTTSAVAAPAVRRVHRVVRRSRRTPLIHSGAVAPQHGQGSVDEFVVPAPQRHTTGAAGTRPSLAGVIHDEPVLVIDSSDGALRRVVDLVEQAPPLGATKLVAIDGLGGAGKTTLALSMAAALSAAVVHLDEIAAWPDGPDWDRLEREVLVPLSEGKVAEYRARDWSVRRLGRLRRVPPGGVVLVEGSESAASVVVPYLSLAIWVECPTEVRLSRTVQRDGEQVMGAWQHWSAWEERYLAADDPRGRVGVTVVTASDDRRAS